MSAKPMPMWQNFWQIMSKEIWIAVFFLGYFNGLMLFVLMSFDDEYDHTTRDAHYAIILIAAPAVIGFNQNFEPKNFSVRVYYSLMIAFGVIGVAAFNAFLIRNLTYPIGGIQVYTIEQILNQNFELVGERATYTKLSEQDEVSELIRATTQSSKRILHFWTVFACQTGSILRLPEHRYLLDAPGTERRPGSGDVPTACIEQSTRAGKATLLFRRVAEHMPLLHFDADAKGLLSAASNKPNYSGVGRSRPASEMGPPQ